MRRDWTPEEKAYLQEACTKRSGEPGLLEALAEELNRTPGSVKSASRRLGFSASALNGQPRGRRWSKAEKRLLREIWREQAGAPDLMARLEARLGRTDTAIASQAKRMRLPMTALDNDSSYRGVRWTPAQEDRLRTLWRERWGDPGLLDAICAEFGRSPSAIRAKAHLLGLSTSALKPDPHARRWAPWEDARLGDLWQKHAGARKWLRTIARKMGRSPSACRARARVLHLCSAPDGKAVFSRIQLAAFLGVDPTSVTHWVDKGLFIPYVQPRDRKKAGLAYRFEYDDVIEWMENPKTWVLWRPESLTDAATREYFTELREGWITAEEAAEILMVARNTVLQFTYTGDLKGSVGKYAALFRRADVEALKAKRDQYGRLPYGYITLEETAAVLGRAQAIVSEWRSRRPDFLALWKIEPNGWGRNIISRTDLFRWLSEQAHWHLFDPADITLPAWRTRLTTLREGWVQSPEAASILGVSVAYTRKLRREGVLPGIVTSPKAIWYRRADVEALAQTWIPPKTYGHVQRPLAAPQLLTLPLAEERSKSAILTE